jgi:hypothetical protein
MLFISYETMLVQKFLENLSVLPLLLPFLVYPFVLIANIMAFAGVDAGDVPFFTRISALSFLWATTLYPVVIGYILYRRRRAHTEEERRNHVYSGYAYVLLCIVLFQIWASV